MAIVTERASASIAPELPADLRLGAVALRVRDAERSAAWYRRALGLVEHRRDPTGLELGDGTRPLLRLREDPAARPSRGSAGLYHYALLYPRRDALASALRRLGSTQTPIEGASDHGTHEAIYLSDDEGNGIELAADRPRERWPAGLGYDRGPAALDLRELLASAAGEEPAPGIGPGMRVGHLHLHVGDIEQGLAFYRDIVGFEQQANLGSAAFLAAGGYHHHLAINVWRGTGLPPAPPRASGLEHWSIELPREGDVAQVRARLERHGLESAAVPGGFLVHDPWRIAVIFTAGADAR